MRQPETLVREVRAVGKRIPDLLRPDRPIVVGYSGGQDSTALLHALTHWRPRLDVRAVHIDHALRPESADAAQKVAAAGRVVGVDRIDIVRVDVAAYRRGLPGWSVQQAARAARHHALAQVAEQDAATVMLAHTADDQAETLLLRLLRGTGLRGLGGMRPDSVVDPCELGPLPPEWATAGRPFRLARPLLRIARATTLGYCTTMSLPVVEDMSNHSRAFTRNRVRLDLLPSLETFNPAVRRILARTADLVAEDVAALDAIVERLEVDLVRDVSTRQRVYDRHLWASQPRALQRRLLRRGLERLTGDLTDVRAAPIEDVLDGLSSASPSATYHLPYGVDIRLTLDTILLQVDGQAARPSRQPRKTRGAQGTRV